MSALALESLADVEALAETPAPECEHLLAVWFPARPVPLVRSRITGTRPCRRSPTTHRVSSRCRSCPEIAVERWCLQCVESLRAEYDENGPVWCLACGGFAVDLAFEPSR